MPIDSGLLAPYQDPTTAQARGFGYADQVAQNAAKYNAGAKFAQGDYTGAAQTQAQAGDIPQAQQTQQYAQQTATKGQQYIAQAFPALQAVFAHAQATDPNNVGQHMGDAFDHLWPEAQALTGASPQVGQVLRQSFIADPQGTLARMQMQIPTEYKTAGDTLFQFRNGVNTGTFEGEKNIVAPIGSNIYQTGGSGGPSAPAAGGLQPPGNAAPAAPGGSSPLIPSVSAPATQAVESRGNPNAVSPAGAVGTMQTMPATLQDPGFGVRPAADNSPQEQTRVGQDYQQALMQHYQNPVLATIAYNMGPGNTDKWLQAGADFSKLPTETQQYLGRIAVAQAIPQQGQQPQPQQQAQQQQGNGVRLIAQGSPVWRAPTDAEKGQYPGATQINAATGEAKYPPLSAIGASLTPDQLQPLVDIVKAGGVLPQRAMSNPAVYSNILKLAQEQGVDTQNFLANQANRKATQSTFQQINTRYSMVQTQEQAFQNSLNLAYSLAQKAGPQGGGTLINGFKNYLKTGVVGDPQTGAFINAVNTAMNEYGKIIEGSTGNAGSSISARADAKEMLSGADNLPAFVAKMQVLQQDAGYKIGALKDQHDTLMQSLKSIGQTPQDAQQSPPPLAQLALRKNPAMRAQFDAKFGAGAAAKVLGN